MGTVKFFFDDWGVGGMVNWTPDNFLHSLLIRFQQKLIDLTLKIIIFPNSTNKTP